MWCRLGRGAGVLLALLLSGCSGSGGFIAPLVGNLDEELAAGRFELINFDETSLTGSPFSRDGTTRAEAAIAAVDLGVKGANAFGRNLDSFSEGSAGVRSFDSFVLVPTRSRAIYEVIDEMVGDRRVKGTVRVEDDGRRLARLTSTGPGSELLLQQDDHPPHLVTQVTGYDTIAPFGKLTFRLLNEEVIDPVADSRSGRLRAEVYRADGTLLYAADANHDGKYSGGYTLSGADIWFAADGFWVKGLSELQHIDASSATGAVKWSASDGQRVQLNFEETGGLNGTVEKDDELVAALLLDEAGRLILVEAGAAGIGSPEPLATFDLQTTPPVR